MFQAQLAAFTNPEASTNPEPAGREDVLDALDAIEGWIPAVRITRAVNGLNTPLKLIWPSLDPRSCAVVQRIIFNSRDTIVGKSLTVNDIVNRIPTFAKILEIVKEERGDQAQDIRASREVLDDALARLLQSTRIQGHVQYRTMVETIRSDPVGVYQNWDGLAKATQFEVVLKIWRLTQGAMIRNRRPRTRSTAPRPTLAPLTSRQLLEGTPDANFDRQLPLKEERRARRAKKENDRAKRQVLGQTNPPSGTQAQVEPPLQFVPQAGRAHDSPQVFEPSPSLHLDSTLAIGSSYELPSYSQHHPHDYAHWAPPSGFDVSSSAAHNVGFPDQLISPAIQPYPTHLQPHPSSAWQHSSQWDPQFLQRPDPRGLVPCNPQLENFPLDPTYASTHDLTAPTYAPTYALTYDPTHDSTPPFDPNQH